MEKRQPILEPDVREHLYQSLTPALAGVKTSEALRIISEAVRPLIPSGADPLIDAGLIFQDFAAPEVGLSPNQARQAWASTSGRLFQIHVQDTINNVLNAEGIEAVEATEITDTTREFLTLPARRRCTQARIGVWPDNDLIVLAPHLSGPRAFCIISCKTSLPERAIESCFWAIATRDTGIKAAFATADLDGELGTCASPTKPRQLLESYFDRTYSTSPATSLCAQVTSLDRVAEDLRRWSLDLLG